MVNDLSINKVRFVEVDEHHDGQRLDNFLVSQLKKVPKTHIYRIIRKGEVRINKGRAKQTTRLETGDIVRIPPVRVSEPADVVTNANRFRILDTSVIYEDEAILILNKPAGMAVHAGSGIKTGIIEAMRMLHPEYPYIELAHRLDRETSGCLVLAKKASVLKTLNQDFTGNVANNKRLEKRYLALVKGRWRYGERRIKKNLNTNARRHGERHVSIDSNGSYAASIVRPVTVSNIASLVEVSLLTGRTHQIRVHLQSEGHPVAGDERYGDKLFNKSLKTHGLKRLFLHAAELHINHPLHQQRMPFKASLPDDLLRTLGSLKLGV